MIVPAWMITILSFSAAVALWLVRPMPRLIRISIMIPLVYFGLLYILIDRELFTEPIKALLVRVGLITIFLPIIFNSVLIRWHMRRGK